MPFCMDKRNYRYTLNKHRRQKMSFVEPKHIMSLAGIALIVGGAIIVAGLNVLQWALL